MEITRPESRQPIPPEAKKVFSGVLIDIYQWDQKVFDGTFKVFEKAKRKDAVSIIAVTENGKIILAHQEQPGRDPFTSTIGGGIDNGEDPLTAAKRELLEETGYEASEWVLYYAVQPNSKIDWAIYGFVAKGCHKVTDQALDGAEKIEMLFLDFDEFTEFAVREDFIDTQLKMKLLEARANSPKMEQVKQLLFGG